MVKNLVAGLLLCSPFHAHTATGQNVLGVVEDGNNVPVEFANVVLLNKNDSSLVGGTVTDTSGCFSFSYKDGCLLRVSCIGFEDFFLDNPMGNVGTISLVPVAVKLGEVVVRANLPIVRMRNDAISVNVSDTYLANAGTAVDLLGRMPFVANNGNDVEVLGKGTPIIYINGRKIQDKSELARLPSDQIKSVDIITNPGAGYDATASAVIRIATVAPVGEGLSLNARTTVGYKHYAYIFQQMNMNYRKGGLDLFSSLNVEDYRERTSTVNNSIKYFTGNTVTEEYSNGGHSSYPVYGAKVGFNYNWNDDNAIGMFYDFSYRTSETSDSYSTVRKTEVTPLENLYGSSIGQNNVRQHLLSAYASGKFRSWLLNANFDAMWKGNDSDVGNREYSDMSGERVFSTANGVSNRLLAGNVTATHRMWKGSVTIGLEVSDVDRHDVYYGNADYVDNSDTKVKETNTAVFGEIAQNFGRLSVTAGLRWEHTDSRFYTEEVRQDGQCRTYSNLSPSAILAYPVGKVGLRLSYSRKTTRPSFDQLSSAVRYLDRYSYESGNPNLRPIYRDCVSLTAQWKDILVMVDYTSTDNYFMWQTMPYPGDDRKTLLQMQNMPRFGSWSAMMNYSPTIGRWRPMLMAAVERQDFTIVHNDEKMELDKPMVIIRFNNSVHLPAGIWLDASLSYRTAGNGENLYMKSQCTFDLGLYKSFRNDKWSVKLQFNDVFALWRQKFSMYDAIVVTSVDKKRDTRDLQLTVRYNFNAAKSKYRGNGAGKSDRDRL